jgi:hypothetical protein
LKLSEGAGGEGGKLTTLGGAVFGEAVTLEGPKRNSAHRCGLDSTKEIIMSSLGTTLLAAAFAIGLSAPASAQSKMDAGSGPTKGAVSTNDAGSGPTAGAKPNTDSTAASDSNDSTDNSAGVTPGPKSTGGSQPVTPVPQKKQ